MKIAVFYELDPGGARRGANEFARAMKALGNQVDLFFIDEKNTGHEKDFYSSVRFYEFQPVHWNGKDWKARLRRDTIELFELKRLHKKIALEIDAKKYDIVFVQPSKFTQAPFILRFLKTPTLYYCQEPLRLVYDPLFAIPRNISFAKRGYEWLSRSIRKIIDQRNISHATTILANSRYTQTNIRRAYGLESHVAHMGVDTSIFYPEKRKKTVDLLFIGTREVSEGYGLFQQSLKFMKREPKVVYLIRGENWTANDAQLRRYYSESKIVMCLGFHEPFGLIPIEAMACGAVPAAINEGGYKDSIQDKKTGLLLEKDPKKIALALDRLLGHNALLERMSKDAVADMQDHWSWKQASFHVLTFAKDSSAR